MKQKAIAVSQGNESEDVARLDTALANGARVVCAYPIGVTTVFVVEWSASPVTARIISEDRVGVGRGPVTIVIEALGPEDAKAITEALAAIGVRPMS